MCLRVRKCSISISSNTLTCLLTPRLFLPLAVRCWIWFTSIWSGHRGMPLGFRGAATSVSGGWFLLVIVTGDLRRRRLKAFAWKHWDKTMIMITVERNVELRIFNSCRLVLLSFVRFSLLRLAKLSLGASLTPCFSVFFFLLKRLQVKLSSLAWRRGMIEMKVQSAVDVVFSYFRADFRLHARLGIVNHMCWPRPAVCGNEI